MNKSDNSNGNITFMYFIFLLFSTSFYLRLSSAKKKFLWKKKDFLESFRDLTYFKGVDML